MTNGIALPFSDCYIVITTTQLRYYPMGKKFSEMNNPKSCLSKAAIDEPIFVLRAKDPLAPEVVRIWAQLAAGIHEQGKIDGAETLANEMTEYQQRVHPERSIK